MKIDALEAIVLLARQPLDILSAYDIAEGIQKLIRLAHFHRILAVWDCNQGLSEKEKLRQSRIEGRISTISEWMRIRVSFQYDPRGYTVKFKTHDGKEFGL